MREELLAVEALGSPARPVTISTVLAFGPRWRTWPMSRGSRTDLPVPRVGGSKEAAWW